ncbi:TetR/AcrR family transcriptional regulator [Streptomyces sp. N2-109]|uniref:TetR/AcrR family transcriptional regulator n=1 Tax=Streptomyces gossypii TaxID=2883101 RepID=A0ABT2K0P3_9ACTN|nr:TetR/AcrR family transcriptional regulator [Streptomyces gossypii]MCT2593531.1 TetR/AcrR family transcriptional regulator [Streptomyces gossypii]
MPADIAKAQVRRPRMTAEREAEVLATALDVLREVGYGAMTMDAVAARAHCSKATLYRLWQGKPELLIAALRRTQPIPEGIDTGSLRGDLMSLAARMSACAEQDTDLVAALGHATLTDQDLVRALRKSLVEPDVAHVTAFVERAVERGELASWPTAAEFLPQMLFAAVVSRPLFEDAYADAEYLASFVERAVLPALLHSSTSSTTDAPTDSPTPRHSWST